MPWRGVSHRSESDFRRFHVDLRGCGFAWVDLIGSESTWHRMGRDTFERAIPRDFTSMRGVGALGSLLPVDRKRRSVASETQVDVVS